MNTLRRPDGEYASPCQCEVCQNGDENSQAQLIRVTKLMGKLAREYKSTGTNATETFITPDDCPETIKVKEFVKDIVTKCQISGIDPEEYIARKEPDSPKVAQLKELHHDLRRRYQLHGSRVEQIWRSFDGNQRLRALQDILAQKYTIPLHPHDRTTCDGISYKFVPDLNLHDITHPAFEYLLELLKYRATTSLFKQYCEVDYAIIISSMLNHNLRHPCEKQMKRRFTKFMENETYGGIVDLSDSSDSDEYYKKFKAEVPGVFDVKVLIPEAQGELIIERQCFVLNFLGEAIGDILYYGSTSRSRRNLPRKPARAVRAALSKISTIDAKPKKPLLPEILVGAFDHKNDLEEYLKLCYEEATLLCHATTNWFHSRPEIIPDEKGRFQSNVKADRNISISIFDMIHSSVTAVAIWDYLARLLQLLVDEPKNKVARVIILQEICNVCHLEYGRVQAMLKRYVQCGSGRKYFRRNSNVYDGSIPRVGLKISPEVLTRENPQLHYMLRLCAAETNASKAITWIKKLDDLHQCHPNKRDEVLDQELESFGHLAVTAGLIQSLSDCLPLPTINLKKGQIFASRFNDLFAKIDLLSTQLDLSDFAVPIHNLLEPGMAKGAMGALDQFLLEKKGTTMKNLYEDLVEECVLQIKVHCERQKEKNEQITKNKYPSILVGILDQTAGLQLNTQQQRQKHKSRPLESCVHGSTPESPVQAKAAQTDIAQAEVEIVKAAPVVFKVKKDTFETFRTLFSKSESHGSISWVAFEAAMADLMFSVIPKFGSVFTFLPPSDMDMGAQKSITFHRPHKSEIEGYQLLIFARRLKRVYGWGENSFVVGAKQHWKLSQLVGNPRMSDQMLDG